MLMVCSIGAAWAADETTFFEYYNAGGVNTNKFFTAAKGSEAAKTYNATFSYNGKNITKCIKMESATTITFTTTSLSKVKILLYARNDDGSNNKTYNRIDFDPEVSGTYVHSDNYNKVAGETVELIYDNVVAGKHTIKRNSADGETELAYISVEYSNLYTLSAPTITFDAETGEVTIPKVAKAKGVYYTTDGTVPSVENGTEYVAPFIVDDVTTVKAIAIGDGTTTANSSVSEKLVLLRVNIDTPVIKSYNGTVAITCGTVYANIEYSTNGTDYVAYSRAFTLAEDATVYARANREGSPTSEVATSDVKVVPEGVKSKTILMGFGSFVLTKCAESETGFSILTGKATDAANGYSLILNVANKDWSGAETITMANGKTRTAIKGSNGAQVILRLPEGVKATKMTLYSYVNKATGPGYRITGWKELNDFDMSSDVTNVPMEANTNKSDYKTNPDVRVFPLDNVTGDITFRNTGEQVCFTIALDVIEPTQPITISDAKFATCVTKTNLDFAGTDVTAYVVSAVGEKTITLAKAEQVPAGNAIVVGAAAGGTYDIPTTTEDVAAVTNLMAYSDAETAVATANTYYIVANGVNGVGFYPVNVDTSIPAGKGFVNVGESGAKGSFLGFGIGDDTTGISEVKAAEAKATAIYNLSGQRVAAPAKGLYIMNGKKVVVK